MLENPSPYISEQMLFDSMWKSINLIRTYVGDKTFNDFKSDQTVQDAVARRIGLIGDLAKSLPQETKDSFSTIPWMSLAELADLTIQNYYHVNAETLWEIAHENLSGCFDAFQVTYNAQGTKKQ